jgi:hypothetical protein
MRIESAVSARTDTERLDWLARRRGCELIRNFDEWVLVRSTGPDTARRLGNGPTLRAAIDAAMDADDAK